MQPIAANRMDFKITTPGIEPNTNYNATSNRKEDDITSPLRYLNIFKTMIFVTSSTLCSFRDSSCDGPCDGKTADPRKPDMIYQKFVVHCSGICGWMDDAEFGAESGGGRMRNDDEVRAGWNEGSNRGFVDPYLRCTYLNDHSQWAVYLPSPYLQPTQAQPTSATRRSTFQSWNRQILF